MASRLIRPNWVYLCSESLQASSENVTQKSMNRKMKMQRRLLLVSIPGDGADIDTSQPKREVLCSGINKMNQLPPLLFTSHLVLQVLDTLLHDLMFALLGLGLAFV